MTTFVQHSRTRTPCHRSHHVFYNPICLCTNIFEFCIICVIGKYNNFVIICTQLEYHVYSVASTPHRLCVLEYWWWLNFDFPFEKFRICILEFKYFSPFPYASLIQPGTQFHKNHNARKSILLKWHFICFWSQFIHNRYVFDLSICNPMWIVGTV